MSNSPEVRPTFVSCWIKSSLILYFVSAVLGFLNSGSEGLAIQLGAGLIKAPLFGLFGGWILWLIKR